MKRLENMTPTKVKIEMLENNVIRIDDWIEFYCDTFTSEAGVVTYVIVEAKQLQPIEVESAVYFWMDYIYQIEEKIKLEDIRYHIWCMTLDNEFEIEFI